MTTKASKNLGVDEQTIAKYWASESRIHLENACAVWNGGLTFRQSPDLERTQRRALSSSTSWDRNYEENCQMFKLEILSDWRLRLARKFAQRTAKDSRHKEIFKKLDNPHDTRAGAEIWWETPSRTRWHLKSPLLYLCRLLNGEGNELLDTNLRNIIVSLDN